MNTIADLLRDLLPSGKVYYHDPRFPRLIRVHKTSFVEMLKDMEPSDLIEYRVRNPEGTGRYSQPRRYVCVWP